MLDTSNSNLAAREMPLSNAAVYVQIIQTNKIPTIVQQYMVLIIVLIKKYINKVSEKSEKSNDFWQDMSLVWSFKMHLKIKTFHYEIKGFGEDQIALSIGFTLSTFTMGLTWLVTFDCYWYIDISQEIKCLLQLCFQQMDAQHQSNMKKKNTKQRQSSEDLQSLIAHKMNAFVFRAFAEGIFKNLDAVFPKLSSFWIGLVLTCKTPILHMQVSNRNYPYNGCVCWSD